MPPIKNGRLSEFLSFKVLIFPSNLQFPSCLGLFPFPRTIRQRFPRGPRRRLNFCRGITAATPQNALFTAKLKRRESDRIAIGRFAAAMFVARRDRRVLGGRPLREKCRAAFSFCAISPRYDLSARRGKIFFLSSNSSGQTPNVSRKLNEINRAVRKLPPASSRLSGIKER